MVCDPDAVLGLLRIDVISEVVCTSASTRLHGGDLSCEVWRSLAVFCDRSLSLVANDEDARGGFDDVVGDGVELVDFEYPVDLWEETF